MLKQKMNIIEKIKKEIKQKEKKSGIQKKLRKIFFLNKKDLEKKNDNLIKCVTRSYSKQYIKIYLPF
jgi:hypothetical protein